MGLASSQFKIPVSLLMQESMDLKASVNESLRVSPSIWTDTEGGSNLAKPPSVLTVYSKKSVC